MGMRIRSNFSNTRHKLVRAKAAVRMSFSGEMKGAARIVAVSLATSTQPFGTGSDAKKQGENAVQADLRKLYGDATDAYVVIAAAEQQMAEAFYKAMQRGRYDKAQKILLTSGSSWRAVPIAEFDSGLHERNRNARGRVSRHVPAQITRGTGAFKGYLKKKVAMVGFGKAGWATCASILESTRGIPQWVTRHTAAPGSVLDGTRSNDKPFIILTNGVRYAHLILTEGAKLEAVRIGLDRYFKNRRVTDVVRNALRRELL
jgi:hypothetical protein